MAAGREARGLSALFLRRHSLFEHRVPQKVQAPTRGIADDIGHDATVQAPPSVILVYAIDPISDIYNLSASHAPVQPTPPCNGLIKGRALRRHGRKRRLIDLEAGLEQVERIHTQRRYGASDNTSNGMINSGCGKIRHGSLCRGGSAAAHRRGYPK